MESAEKPSLNAEDYNLPKVEIEKIPPKTETKGTMWFEDYAIKDHQGNEIGKFKLEFQKNVKEGKTSALLERINVIVELRGKGFGRSAYLNIIQMLQNRGIKFKSSTWQLSRGSSKVWEWLVENGLAIKTLEGSVDETKEYAAYSSAEYEAI